MKRGSAMFVGETKETRLAPIASDFPTPTLHLNIYLRPQIWSLIRPSNLSKITRMIQDLGLNNFHPPSSLNFHECLRHPTPAIARLPNLTHWTCEILSVDPSTMTRYLLPLDHDLLIRN